HPCEEDRAVATGIPHGLSWSGWVVGSCDLTKGAGHGQDGAGVDRGAVGSVADGFRGELERLEYSPLTAEEQLRLMAHLSRWLEDGRLGVGELTAARAQEFVAYRQA
ncbi:MAG: hypothetical protein ACR2L9_11625, partial [Solirubrobacteraceae bacterium]